MSNLITKTDSYKNSHGSFMVPGTQQSYAYFESRLGAKYPVTAFSGLQAILLKHLVGQVITTDKIDKAEKLLIAHMGSFDRSKWDYIVEEFDGKLPLEIKAVNEGSVIPINNVLLTVRNTDTKSAWLSNYVESILTHLWYTSNVATISYTAKKLFQKLLLQTCDQGENFEGLDFMLHDFGYRGCAVDEQAAVGGLSHLLSFLGTDTIVALEAGMDFYGVTDVAGFSIPATEHSIMTAECKEGEENVVERILNTAEDGLLSLVIDSYNFENFISNIAGKTFKDRILSREGKTVFRPDSGEPVETSLTVLRLLEEAFGSTLNEKGYKILNPKVGFIWGDGIDLDGIESICLAAIAEGWSVENLVFGMGGNLLQRHDRDTQRNAFKCSAQMRDGEWFDVYKDPIDKSKASKRGRLKLISEDGKISTVRIDEPGEDLLKTVFLNGELTNFQTLNDIRENIRRF